MIEAKQGEECIWWEKGAVYSMLSALSHGSGVNLPAVFVANGLGVALMLVLLLGRHKRGKFVSVDGRLFKHMCQLSMTLCILEICGFWVDGKQFWGARQLNVVISSALFASNAVFTCFWICYVNYKLFQDKQRLKRRCPIVVLPAAVICIMCIVNLFTDVFFGVSAENVYYRRPLCILTYLVAFVYMISGAVLVFLRRNRMERNLFITVVAYLVPIFAASVIQYFNYGLSLIWVSTALGLTILYINLQHELFYLDPLTNLYNRNYLFDYVAQMATRGDRLSSKGMMGIMVDINNFKYINDTYGHLEGDVALRNVGKVLRDVVDPSGVVVRYGGDEFVILMEERQGGEELDRLNQRVIEAIKAYNASGVSPYPISMAVGKARLKSADVESFFREMDQDMYIDKRKFYFETGIDGGAV